MNHHHYLRPTIPLHSWMAKKDAMITRLPHLSEIIIFANEKPHKFLEAGNCIFVAQKLAGSKNSPFSLPF